MKIDPGGMVPGGMLNMVLTDASGKPITDFTAEQIEFLKSCRIGQLSATDISQYTNQIEKVVKEISQATQTPIYGITAQGNVSGDALKQLEIGLIGKCQRFQRQNTDAIKELIMLTAKMERVFKPGLGTPEIKSVSVTWKSPELLDVDAQVKTLITMRKDAPGLWADSFYQNKIGQLLGLSKTDITNEIDAATEQADEEAESITGANGTPPQGGDASQQTMEAMINELVNDPTLKVTRAIAKTNEPIAE
jgi:hypothetical protein